MRTREELLQASRGYWASRALLTAVEIGLFEALGARGRSTAAQLARRLGTQKRATGLLLDALTGLGVLVKREARYGLRREMVPYLTEGDASALGMLRHHARLWNVWSHLTESVRVGRPPGKQGGFRGDAEAARAFTLAMREGARRLAPQVAGEVSFRGRRCLLDLGGGPGVYAAAFARRYPALQVVVVDLPAVCAVGRELVAQGEPDVANRIRYHPADLDHGDLPEGDAAFLSHVIHSQTPEAVRALFRRVRRVLPAGGLFVVRDFFTTPDRTRPPGASLFALNMLVNDTGGRSYAAQEVAEWMRRAGFASASYRRSKAVPDAGYVIARR
ncbi:MAG: methyltransferase [Planctomycetota bacterium]